MIVFSLYCVWTTGDLKSTRCEGFFTQLIVALWILLSRHETILREEESVKEERKREIIREEKEEEEIEEKKEDENETERNRRCSIVSTR